MQIGVIGWWNYDNQGDLAMLASLREGLAPHHVVPIDVGFPTHPDTIYRLNRLDYVILGGGTLISGKPAAPFDTFDRWGGQLDCPLGVVGLGVDPFSDQYWPAVAAMIDSAQFFYVRDQVSRRLLRNHPKVQVSPDLTFAYPLPSRDAISDVTGDTAVCGVNLRRSGSTDFDPEPWAEVLKKLPVQIRAVPLSSFDVFGENTFLEQLDPDYPKRFDPALYREMTVMIGAAFHSILFAVQSTVPVIAIDYAPKVRHFMTDNGLGRYLLASDEHYKLSALVNELLTNRSQVTAELCAVRENLHQAARQNIEIIRKQIERSGSRHRRNGPQATIVVIGSGNVEKDQRTQTACKAQMYENIEMLFVPAQSQESIATRLQHVLEQASGDYFSWIDGGDWFAEDALDCLISLLETEPHWDVVYSDYYAMSDSNLPLGHHVVPGPEKLYRRDVVGPCFLMRRALLPLLGKLPADTQLVAYSLWLSAQSHSTLAPFHAPLFYSSRTFKSSAFIAKERAARQYWRRTQPLWKRIVWGIIDTDWGERLIVQPIARMLKLLRG